MKRKQCQYQAHSADYTGENSARIGKLINQCVNSNQHQDVCDIRVGDNRQQLRAPVGFEMFDSDLSGGKHYFIAKHVDRAAVDLGQQIRDAGCNQIDDVHFKGILGGQTGCFAHGQFRPVGITPAHLRQSTDIRDGIVD